jgi:hypothetical protein
LLFLLTDSSAASGKQQSVPLFPGVAFGQKHAPTILIIHQLFVFTIFIIFSRGSVSSQRLVVGKQIT